MKKIINNTNDVVNEMLDGMVVSHPDLLRRLPELDVIVRKDPKVAKVALVSGGGSGHEPAHAGFVGEGMLDAAVAGAVFTSPTPDQVYEAVKATDAGKGVLLIIKNYTGDVLNFEMAEELAQGDDILVEKVIVADDVAVEDSTWTIGRRGIAGTIFVHKIAGAKAEQGAELSAVKTVAQKVVDNVRSMGMAVSPCSIPGSKASFELADNEMEMGIGIHGEPGTHREALKSADEITIDIVTKILAEDIYHTGDEVAVLVNGLGSTTLMEQYVISKKLHQLLADKGIKIFKTYIGNYMTSLEMGGFSISLLKLDSELKELLLAPANTAALTQI